MIQIQNLLKKIGNYPHKIKDLIIQNDKLENIIKKQIKEINQNKLDEEEFEFLKLNLLYSSKCQKSAFKKGYTVGTPEYKNCILKEGRE
jgi:rod shape-determining protein MreC